MASDEELGQDSVQELKLAGSAVQELDVCTAGVEGAFDLIEAERVVADLGGGEWSDGASPPLQ